MLSLIANACIFTLSNCAHFFLSPVPIFGKIFEKFENFGKKFENFFCAELEKRIEHPIQALHKFLAFSRLRPLSATLANETADAKNRSFGPRRKEPVFPELSKFAEKLRNALFLLFTRMSRYIL